LSDAADALDKAAHGQIRELLRSGDMDGKMGSTRLLYRVAGVAAERVLLVGLGREKEFGEKAVSRLRTRGTCRRSGNGARDACLYFAELHVPDRDAAWKARQLVLAAADVTYRFDRMKSKKAEETSLLHVAISAASKRDAGALERGMREGSAIAAGMTLARDLGNLPANVCTPTYLADTSVKLGREWKLAVEVLEQKDMEKLGWARCFR